MAKKKTVEVYDDQVQVSNGRVRKWSVPSKRATGFAEERRLKVHKWGPKKGKQLTDYEAGLRSGYLKCQDDHAGVYKYKQGLSNGLSKKEAAAYSRRVGKSK